MKNNFSENLKKIRKDYNLSQEQLAEALGVSRQAISKWEQSVAYPEMDKILALCDKFNLNIDDLLHKDIKEVKREEESKKSINKYIDDSLNFLTDTISLFSNMSLKSKLKCISEQIIIILVLSAIITLVYVFFDYALDGILQLLPENLYNIISSITQYSILLFLFLVALIMLIHIFKIRYLDYYDSFKKTNINSSEIDSQNKILFQENQNKIIIRDPRKSEYKFIKMLFKFIVVCLKVLLLWIVLFASIVLVFLLGCFVLSFLLYKTGFLFMGLLGSTLSLAVINVIVLTATLNIIFNRKNDKKKMIYIFIVALITLGLSIGLICIGTLDLDIGSDSYYLKKETIEYDMKDNMFFNLNQDIQYIESDIDNIKLEYKVSKYCDMENMNSISNGVHVWCNYSNSLDVTKEFIKSLNNKKVVLFDSQIKDVKVYASKENIEKLKNNKINYEVG